MRNRNHDEDDDDPKRPRPARTRRKGTNPREGAEASPLHGDEDHDRHMHVC